MTAIQLQPYAKHVEELSRVMEAASYEPEVCLAVRIPGAVRADGVPAPEPEEEQDENADIDTTLMSFGFEYVDGTSEAVPRTEKAADDVDQGAFLSILSCRLLQNKKPSLLIYLSGDNELTRYD